MEDVSVRREVKEAKRMTRCLNLSMGLLDSFQIKKIAVRETMGLNFRKIWHSDLCALIPMKIWGSICIFSTDQLRRAATKGEIDHYYLPTFTSTFPASEYNHNVHRFVERIQTNQ